MPLGSTCDITAPMLYGEASLARRRGRARLKWHEHQIRGNLLLHFVEGLVAGGSPSPGYFFLQSRVQGLERS